MDSQKFVSGWNSSQVLQCLPPQYLVRFDLLSLITLSMYAQKISSSFVLSTWFTISFSSKSSNSYCYSDSFTFPVLTYSVLVQIFFLNLFFLHVSQSPQCLSDFFLLHQWLVVWFDVSLRDWTMVGGYILGRGGLEIKSQST